MNNKTVTCSFTMDRELYNSYKGIVSKNGENVKGNLINYMKSVIQYDLPNAETLSAVAEVEQLKKNPVKKTYTKFSDLLKELN